MKPTYLLIFILAGWLTGAFLEQRKAMVSTLLVKRVNCHLFQQSLKEK